MAAVALAKVVRGGRSVTSSQPLLRAILPHLGSTPAAPAAGMGRLMHTGLVRARGVRPQEQLARMDRFGGKRFMSSEEEHVPAPRSFVALGAASAFGFIMTGIYVVPGTIRSITSLVMD